MNYQVVDYIVRPKNYSICKLDVNKYNIIKINTEQIANFAISQ